MLLPACPTTMPEKSLTPERLPISMPWLLISRSVLALLLALPALAGAQKSAATGPAPPLMDAMTSELHRAFTTLGKDGAADGQKQMPPYFLSYAVSDSSEVAIEAQYGALVSSAASHVRVADVQVRVGSPGLDNTHGAHRASAVNSKMQFRWETIARR